MDLKDDGIPCDPSNQTPEQVSVPVRGNGFERPIASEEKHAERVAEVSVPVRGNGFERTTQCLSMARKLKLGFPSPLGVMDLKAAIGESVAVGALRAFPSPLGVMDLKDLDGTSSMLLLFWVSVPVRGNGFESQAVADC